MARASLVAGGPGSTGVARLPARLPLDVTTEAGPLLVGDRFAGEHGVERLAEVLAGDRDRAPRPAVVELSPVDERPVAIEDVEVGGTGGLVGPGDVLAL